MRYSTFALADLFGKMPSAETAPKVFWYSGLYQICSGSLAMLSFKQEMRCCNVAHVKKFTRENMKGLSIHLDRKTENHSNKEIAIERSHLNYDLCEKEGDTLSRLQNRLDEVYCMKRKDVKACCEWVVTLPTELEEKGPEEQRQFFEKTYEFLAARYGKENVVSANVHVDETTPHMHFDFVPVVWDEKKQREKVSAKEVLTRNELKSFHQDLDNFLKKEIPEIYQEGILNGKTIGIEDIKEFKKYADDIKMQKKEIADELKTFKKPKEIVEKIEKSAKNAIFTNKVTLPSSEYKKLIDVAKSSVKIKYTSEKKINAASEEIQNLKASVQRADQRANKFENRANELEKQLEGTTEKLKEARKNEIVFKSKLQDTNQDLNISELEKKGRLIMFNLENVHNPRNEQEGEEWLSILQENKKAKTIPENRLEGFLGLLKAFLDRLLEKSRQFSMDGLKRQQERINRQNSTKKKNKSKSYDMEL